MRELAILTFVTLDGVMQGVGSPKEDSSNQFTHGGWAVEYWDEIMEQVRQHAMSDPYDMLFGRKTFEMFSTNRVKGADRSPDAKMMDEATKYVVSSSLTKTEWQNTSILTGELYSEITKLKKQDGPLLQIHGSWQLIQA